MRWLDQEHLHAAAAVDDEDEGVGVEQGWDGLGAGRGGGRRPRSARCRTQPVTQDEVAQAALRGASPLAPTPPLTRNITARGQPEMMKRPY